MESILKKITSTDPKAVTTTILKHLRSKIGKTLEDDATVVAISIKKAISKGRVND